MGAALLQLLLALLLLALGIPALGFGVFWGRNSCGLVIPFAESESESALGCTLWVGTCVYLHTSCKAKC